MSERHEICPVSDLPPGERRIVDIDGLPHSIGVFNVDGDYHALANVCPHQLAPLCEGSITGEAVSEGVGDYGLTREGEVIRCPWHGWKFDLADGTSVFNPHELRVRSYEVAIEGQDDRRPDDEGRDRGACGAEIDEYGTPLAGDDPPVDTYPVEVEEDVVVVYV